MSRSPGIYQEWIDAIKDRSKKTTSNFEYAARLTETMLLGNVAVSWAGEHKVLEYAQGVGIRTRCWNTHKVLEYDGAAMRFTNDEAANAWLDQNYRPGFGLM